MGLHTGGGGLIFGRDIAFHGRGLIFGGGGYIRGGGAYIRSFTVVLLDIIKLTFHKHVIFIFHGNHKNM